MMECHRINEASNRIPTSLMAKLRLQHDDTQLDVTELIKKAQEKKFCRLECDAECLRLERNKRLAEALDIKEPEHEASLVPGYSESMKQYTLENLDFVSHVYDTLVNLVNDAKRSTLAFKNHNFPPMRQDQRHMIHELAEHFGCKSHGVDQEPNRSVVVKAPKERCSLPTMSILDVVQKKATWLVMSKKNPPIRRSEKPSSSSTLSKPAVKEAWKPKDRPKEVDYFDFDGD